MRAARLLAILATVALAAFAGWRIVATRVSDDLSHTAPRRALAWDAHNPQAMLALAQQEVQNGNAHAAAARARALLQHAPLQADAFTVIARASAAGGHEDAARPLFALALRRAPRNPYARAWTIGDQLHRGQYAAALQNVDTLLGIAPAQRTLLIPLLTRVAGHDPAFADALGRFLGRQPPWRGAMLDDLLAHAPLAAVDNVFEALSSTPAGLDDDEAQRWFARLGKEGHWGEAYSLWVGRIGLPPGGTLPAVHNGSFEEPVAGGGFGWSMRGEPGVQIERARVAGASGTWAAAVTFRGRRASDMGFEQTLLLAPGRYRLAFRARAEELRSDKGLEWDIDCIGGGPPIATSERLGGSFDWKPVATDFTVPATDCPAQRLMLANPGAGGTGKIVSGKLWVDDFHIAPLPPTPIAPPGAPATITPHRPPPLP